MRQSYSFFDKKEKTVATKVQKSKLEKYETENIKLLKKLEKNANHNNEIKKRNVIIDDKDKDNN